jgi:Uma2 family endonuclease
MATSAAQTYLTPEEYITLERKAIPDAETVRSEYVKGKIIAMSGASRAQNLITMNISTTLHVSLKGQGCETYANEMRVSTPSTSSYFYPDVVVVCEEPRFEDDVFDILLNPIILVEVLSPSTEAYDRGEKFSHYRQLPSLQEYVLVAQDKICVERFSRQENNWMLTDFQNLDQRLPLVSVQCELPLHEIYDRVTFPE